VKRPENVTSGVAVALINLSLPPLSFYGLLGAIFLLFPDYFNLFFETPPTRLFDPGMGDIDR